jgi:hypothetical protein
LEEPEEDMLSVKTADPASFSKIIGNWGDICNPP